MEEHMSKDNIIDKLSIDYKEEKEQFCEIYDICRSTIHEVVKGKYKVTR
ncbi:hypothetical protein LCGC14_1775050 [marine sediment metagenome]|uniref:Uncharacterized protein n=1 Tax=marine sediment metagenome TaxID=412755 RepID=A0A0F9HJM3_9ZZZZ